MKLKHMWKFNSLFKPKQNSLCGGAGYAINNLSAGQATKKCVGETN